MVSKEFGSFDFSILNSRITRIFLEKTMKFGTLDKNQKAIIIWIIAF